MELEICQHNLTQCVSAQNKPADPIHFIICQGDNLKTIGHISFGFTSFFAEGSSLNHVANFLKILTPPPPQMAKHDHLMNPQYGTYNFTDCN